MSPAEFHLLRPEWLLALLPLALGLWRLARASEGTPAWRGLVDAHLLPHLLVGDSVRTARTPLLLLGVGGLLGILALAGPVWRRLPQPVYTASAERVIVADISATMNATDVAPSRLARARFEIMDLLRRFNEGQTALIAYGAEPYVVSPLTTDARTIAAQVPALSSDLLPVQGAKRTDLALAEAGRLLAQAGSTHGGVILVTDGLDHPAAALEAARALRGQGYRVSVLGVGTAQGAPVPAPGGGFLQGAGGKVLMPALDTGPLASLATAGGGRYVTATADDRNVDALAREVTGEPRETATQDKRETDQWREEGPWLLLALLPFAALAFRRGWLSPLLLVLLLAPPPPAQASWWSSLWSRPDQAAARLLQQGDAREAAQRFERPDWRAASDYAAGEYADALNDLKTIDAPTAWYDRGNTLARMGSLQDAVDAYDHALAANPRDADAKYNRGLVKRLLEEQQRKQQTQPQSGSNKQPPGDKGGKGAGAPEGGNTGEPAKASTSSGQADQPSTASASSADGAAGRSGERNQSKQQRAPSAEGQAPQPESPSNESVGTGATPRAAQDNAAGAQADDARSKDAQSKDAQSKDAQSKDARANGAQTNTNETQANAARANPTQGDQADKQGANGAAHAASSEQNLQSAATGAGQQNTAAGAAPANSSPAPGAAPGLADLLGSAPAQPPSARAAAVPKPLTEAQQAVENQLNQVPDDPAGLLRQRFLLQHLRRTGQL